MPRGLDPGDGYNRVDITDIYRSPPRVEASILVWKNDKVTVKPTTTDLLYRIISFPYNEWKYCDGDAVFWTFLLSVFVRKKLFGCARLIAVVALLTAGPHGFIRQLMMMLVAIGEIHIMSGLVIYFWYHRVVPHIIWTGPTLVKWRMLIQMGRLG